MAGALQGGFAGDVLADDAHIAVEDIAAADDLGIPRIELSQFLVTLKGNGNPEQMQEIHDEVMRLSPNRFNLATAIPLKAELVVG